MSANHGVERAVKTSERLAALTLGLLTSALWASSFVIVKILLPYMGPMSIGGFRYLFGCLVLLPLVLRNRPSRIASIPRKLWLRLALAGLLGYTVANGLLFWGLKWTSPTTSSFLFNLTPFIVVALGFYALREAPGLGQWLGLAIVVAGVFTFFSLPIEQAETVGIVATLISAAAFAAFNVQSRALSRDSGLGTVLITALPLLIGAVTMIILALVIEGPAQWNFTVILAILWLGGVNTALANTIWIRAMGSLKAYELIVLMNLMPAETALIAWLVMDEQLSLQKLAGMALLLVGVMLVQLAGVRRQSTARADAEAGTA